MATLDKGSGHVVGIEFCFLAGTYHATPWGRHANEADVEWPPSPWRILRSFIGVYHRYSLSKRYDEDVLHRLIEGLAADRPMYRLPSAVHTHTKHFMPIAGGKTTLVHDAFLRVLPGDPLGVYWLEAHLDAEALALLDEIATFMPYLGRAESWGEGRLVREPPDRWDAMPIDVDGASELLDRAEGEIVDLLAPVTPSEWPRVRGQWPTGGRKSGLAGVSHLLDALRLGTDVIEKERLNMPVGATHLTYVRRKLDLRSDSRRAAPCRMDMPHVQANVARFRLVSKLPTRIICALDVGEVMHTALDSMAARTGLAMPSLTGRDPETRGPLRDNHRHVFILPVDEDLDGHLDHVVVYKREPFDREEVKVFQALRQLKTPAWWPGRERHWQLYLEGMWCVSAGAVPREEAGPNVPDAYVRPSRVFTSITPYLHPWHWKRGGAKFGPADQIREELRRRGFPEPVAVEARSQIRLAGLPYDARKFRKLRYNAHQKIPARTGGLWRIEFAEPVYGPIALGVNCHLGMGLFYAGELDSVKFTDERHASGKS
ncbi:type I-U CRISPR-associated protein Csb2 [Alicyclobacillus mali (ex Roth et al. 2021)]|nr:type I-U CRISPR-associated protein Csb2 [Alicyclobacillus mali (ex Roth et al. 2021)]